jgi:hypothetical protein
MIEHIDEELEGAKEYAEKFVEWKAKGNIQRANVYKEMAQDELRHAAQIHEFSAHDFDAIRKVYSVPMDVDEAWEHATKHFTECTAWIKHMLT